jgi:glycosyltransferase involved in cell wall biosynthesis
MKVWAYVIAWNEELMLPYYLRHYSTFCDKIIVYDNMSTDSTRMIAESYGDLVEVVPFDSGEEFNDYVHIELKRNSLKNAKGNADFVILCDCDEFVFHKDIRSFLNDNKDCSVFYPAGFQMISDDFPKDLEGQLYDYVQWGEPSPWYTKPMIINLNVIDDVNWVEGAHELDPNLNLGSFWHPVPEDIRPIGEYKEHVWGKWQKMWEILDTFNSKPLKMLHYKYLGADYVSNRYKLYAKKMSKENHDNNIGMHYEIILKQGSDAIQKEIDEIKLKAVRVKI